MLDKGAGIVARALPGFEPLVPGHRGQRWLGQ
jgi:hypothetical protein